MHKLNLLVLLIIIQCLFNQEVLAQCGTPEKTDEEMEVLPWFGNNQYLYDLVDSLASNPSTNQRNISCDNTDVVMLPIQFWIYRESVAETVDFPDTELLQAMMDNLNSRYQNSGMNVRFVMLPVQTIFDTGDLDVNDIWDALRLNSANKNKSAINVHIVRNLDGAGGRYYSGLGLYEFIIVERHSYANSATTPNSPSVLSHEIGHYFGLEHTHRNSDKGKCRQESVSRTRRFGFCIAPPRFGIICENSGDALCDTPADSKLTGKVNNLTDCQYIGGETDNWGDWYIPDTRNVMSYSLQNCRNRFSPLQVAVMKANILLTSVFSRSFIKDVNDTFLNADHYEPDNSAEVARPIALGETQCHSFSDVQNFVDERDWLSIDNSNGVIGTYTINITPPFGLDLVDDVNVYYTDINGQHFGNDL